MEFEKAVYVLHCFHKKAHKGIKTDAQDIELIKKRLDNAAQHYRKNYAKDKKP